MKHNIAADVDAVQNLFWQAVPDRELIELTGTNMPASHVMTALPIATVTPYSVTCNIDLLQPLTRN